MKIFSHAEVTKLLTAPVCVSLMKEAFADLENGTNTQIVRTGMALPKGGLAYMPSSLGARNAFGAKIISVYPNNSSQGYPSHQGYVLLFDGTHGEPVAMADAAAITEVRTGAASGAATDLLARKDSHVLAILGSGAQAYSHLEAMCCVRNITEVHVWSYHLENAQLFAKNAKQKHGLPVFVHETVEEAVANAHIICTVCRTKEPILKAKWVAKGTHINAVGTCNPMSRELDTPLVAKSRMYVDQIEACKAESGDYLIPLNEKAIDENHIVGTIGGILCGTVEGRTCDDEITVFDSLGLGVQDVICAHYLSQL